ncbi:MAG TPA: NfeD family protein [Egibacteraceae bacterium]|nr:hypothetical protein [Actinomycetota bacterium]HWB71677.1 NfeD family protein [Egibacteraceae bacterium]
MTAFVVVGALGLVIVLAALLLGDLLDGVFGAVSPDTGGGLLSSEVIGSFLATFGFGAALLMWGLSLPPAAAGLGGLAAGTLVGVLAWALGRSVMRMPTDRTMRTGDLVGAFGTVVTRIPRNGYGEVAVNYLGQRHKLNARAESPLAQGTAVVVVSVSSPTSVVVTEADF